ncbi:hypothetical protein Q7A53_02050 [Halobacillus rhizosphaerae]|uniref:hypothetical protein n=1 Tax=Halobacillus rhizosphaerae TaxID=3064889 RepID=UPI00398BBB5C
MPIYFSEKDYESILEHNSFERKVFVPNEFFSDWLEVIDVDEDKKSSKHIAFGYSYYYLITYLYRYTVYGKQTEYSLTEDTIKKMLTVSPHSKGKNGVNYISKRGGLLEKIGYIRKTKDFPVMHEFYQGDQEVIFRYISELKEEGLSSDYETNYRNYTISEPIHLTNGYKVDTGDGYDEYINPTKDEIDDTTMIPIDVFIFCVTREALGIEAFYIYSILKYYSSYFGGKWNCPLDKLPEAFGMKIDTIKRKMKSLEEHNMIFNSHSPYVVGLRDYTDKTILANSYSTFGYSNFIKNESEMLKVEVRKVYSPESYEKLVGFSRIDDYGDDDDFVDLS